MENLFQLIMDKLNAIENLIKAKETNTIPSIGIEEILDLNKTSSYIGISKSTIYKFTSKRAIPHFKRGKKLYFKKSELDEWLTTHKVLSSDEIEKLASTYLATRKRKHWN